MTIETIRLEIPNDPLVLKATANVLLKLSGDNSITDSDIAASVFETPTTTVKTEAGAPPAPASDTAPETAPPAPPASAPATNDASEGDSTTAAPATPANVTVVAPGEAAGNEPGVVYVDADGLPWDERIDGANKLTLKKGGTWKRKRGVDPALIETVNAELRLTMAAPAATTEAATPDNVVDITKATTPAATAPPPPPNAATAPAPPAAVPTVTKYITEDGGEFTFEELIAAQWTEEQIYARESFEEPIEAAPASDMTFPVLMNLITTAIAANQIDDAAVMASCNNHGIPSLPLLSARPDLIPKVHADLFG